MANAPGAAARTPTEFEVTRPMWGRFSDEICDLSSTIDCYGAVSELLGKVVEASPHQHPSLNGVSAERLQALMLLIESSAKKNLDQLETLVELLKGVERD